MKYCTECDTFVSQRFKKCYKCGNKLLYTLIEIPVKSKYIPDDSFAGSIKELTFKAVSYPTHYSYKISKVNKMEKSDFQRRIEKQQERLEELYNQYYNYSIDDKNICVSFRSYNSYKRIDNTTHL